MALHTLGTTSTTALNAITFAPAQGVGQASAASILSPSDLAAIASSIVGDGRFAATNPTGILATGTLANSSKSVTALVHTAGGPLASIGIGNLVLGVGVLPGTFVAAKPSGTSVTLTQNTTSAAAGTLIDLAFVPVVGGKLSFEGFLELPGGRGQIKVFPGDVVAIDNTGWPILISAASIAYAGSLWSFV